MTAVSAELFRFCLVGCIGFLVDAGLTLVLTQVAAISPAPARIAAFVVAATVTWQLNGRFTFRSAAGAETWVPYLLLTAVGAAINVGLYVGWVRAFGAHPLHIVAGVACGSLVALGSNFVVSRQFIFRPHAVKRHYRSLHLD